MKRPLLCFIIAFIIGIFLYSIKLGIAIFAISFILCEIYTFLFKKEEKSKLAILYFCIFLGSFFVWQYNYFRINEVKKFNEKEVEILSIVADEGKNKGEMWQYLLKGNRVNNINIKSKIILKTKKELKIGDKINIYGVLEIPKGSSNSGLFNYGEYLRTIDVYSTIKSNNITILERNKLNFIQKISMFFRRKVREFSRYTLTEENAPILDALVIGDGSQIDIDLEDNYKKAGMLHLLVVSGGHTVFLMMLIMWITNFLGISKKSTKIITILIIGIYIFITGATPSILRAGIGIIIVILAEIIGRQNDSFTTMGVVALIILLNNPNVLFSLSFLLSFGGVLGIVICYPKINKKLNKLPKSIKEAFSLTLAAQLFVTPITMYNFNTIYLGGLISNILTLNLSGIIMMGGIILFVLYLFIPPITILPMKIIEILIVLMNFIANFFGKIKFLTRYVVTPNEVMIVVYYICMAYVFLYEKKESKNAIISCENKIKMWIILHIKTVVAVLGIISIFININFNNELKITLIDVGHGDSILITTPNNKNILIDTGDKYDQKGREFDCGEKIVAPYLLKKGINKLDLIILTHLDSDHIGGFNSIGNMIKVKEVGISINSDKKMKYKYIKKDAIENLIDIRYMERGQKFEIDGVKFKVLLPIKVENIENENNDSIVLLVEYKNKRILLMGDLEAEGEKLLLSLEENLDIDILKVGHHGSGTSTIQDFLNETTPEIALISVGNRFKSIPSKDVLNRLSSIYTKVYRTDEDGEINVYINSKNNKVKTRY